MPTLLLSSQADVAGAARKRILQVALYKIVAHHGGSASERHVIDRAVRQREEILAKRPSALVRILSAAGIRPARARVWIGRCFFKLVSYDRDHAVNASV